MTVLRPRNNWLRHCWIKINIATERKDIKKIPIISFYKFFAEANFSITKIHTPGVQSMPCWVYAGLLRGRRGNMPRASLFNKARVSEYWKFLKSNVVKKTWFGHSKYFLLLYGLCIYRKFYWKLICKVNGICLILRKKYSFLYYSSQPTESF